MFRLSLCFFGMDPQRRTLRQALNMFKVRGAHPDLIAFDPPKSIENGQSLAALETFLDEWQTHRARRAAGPFPRVNQLAPKRLTVRFWLGDPLTAIEESLTVEESDALVRARLVKLLGTDFELPSAHGATDSLESLHDVVQSGHTSRERYVSLVPLLTSSLERLRRYGVMLLIQTPDGICHSLSEPELLSGGKNTHPSIFFRDRGMRKFHFELLDAEDLVRVVEIVQRIEKTYNTLRGQSVRTGVTVVLSLKESEYFLAPDGCIVLALAGNAFHNYESFLLSLSAAQWKMCQDTSQKYRYEDAQAIAEWKKTGQHLAKVFNVHAFRVSLRPTTSPTVVSDFLNRMMSGEGTCKAATAKYLELRNPKHLQCVSIRMEYNLPNGVDFVLSDHGEIHVASHVTVPQVLKILRDHGKASVQNWELCTGLEDVKRKLHEALPRVRFEVDTPLREKRDYRECFLSFLKTMDRCQHDLSRALGSRTHKSEGGSSWYVLASDRFDAAGGFGVKLPWDVTPEKLRLLLLSK